MSVESLRRQQHPDARVDVRTSYYQPAHVESKPAAIETARYLHHREHYKGNWYNKDQLTRHDDIRHEKRKVCKYPPHVMTSTDSSLTIRSAQILLSKYHISIQANYSSASPPEAAAVEAELHTSSYAEVVGIG